MKKIVKPHKTRKPSASTDVPSFARGKDQILKSPTRLQRRKKNELDEFDDGKDDIIKSVNQSTNKFWNQGSPQRLYHYFINNGIPRNQALGIIGNIAQESAFDPNKSNGNAFGYVQNGKMIQDYINTVYGGSGEKEQMKYLVDGLKHQLPVAKNYRQLQNRFDKFNELAIQGVIPENVASLFDRIYERSEGVDDLQRKAYAGNYSQMIPENSDLVQTPSGYGYIRSYNEDGSVNVLDNDRKTRTFKSLELPEVIVTADRRPYKSYFDGSLMSTLNTIGSMFGLTYDKGKDSGIHIKKANRGKFTAAAKRAGMGVQAYARKILSAPKGKYSPTLRRRAAFAKAASKFKH